MSEQEEDRRAAERLLSEDYGKAYPGSKSGRIFKVISDARRLAELYLEVHKSPVEWTSISKPGDHIQAWTAQMPEETKKKIADALGEDKDE